jgi:tol-pal system beta propeller repeat protein TolB
MLSSPNRRFMIAGALLLVAVAFLLIILIRDVLTPPQLSGTLIFPDGPQLNRINVVSGKVEILSMDKPGIRRSLQMVISPNRKWLAFTAADEETQARLYIAALDGSQSRPLTNGPVDMQPQWSPDSQQIVFTRAISPRSALFRVNIETGEEFQLTNYANDLEPYWSPDGSRIVFTTSRDGFQELYTMSPDGSDLKRLTENEGLNDLQGVYSPDGDKIAYITNRSVGDQSSEIWVMNADGSDQHRLTNNDRYDHLPVWSPDSTRIAFSSKRTFSPSADWDIFVYDLTEDTLHQLTDAPGFYLGPVWSPDGNWIAMTAGNETDEPDLMLMRADGSDKRLLLPDIGYRPLDGLIWLS